MRILIEPYLLAELLRIQSPPLGVGGILLVLTKGRQVARLLRDRKLQMMSGNTLVIRDRFRATE